MKLPKHMKMLSEAQELVALNVKANDALIDTVRFQELFNKSVKFAEAYLESQRVISVVASNIASSRVRIEKESKAVGDALQKLDSLTSVLKNKAQKLDGLTKMKFKGLVPGATFQRDPSEKAWTAGIDFNGPEDWGHKIEIYDDDPKAAEAIRDVIMKALS